MAGRKVKLAQVMCAVLALNKPSGASLSEIVDFCVLRFGCQRNVREFKRVLERAVEAGLLKRFLRRYTLARMTNYIIWADDKKSGGRSKRSHQHDSKSRRSKSGRSKLERSNSGHKLRYHKRNLPKHNGSSRAKSTRFNRVCLKSTPKNCKAWCQEKRRKEITKSRRQKRLRGILKRKPQSKHSFCAHSHKSLSHRSMKRGARSTKRSKTASSTSRSSTTRHPKKLHRHHRNRQSVKSRKIKHGLSHHTSVTESTSRRNEIKNLRIPSHYEIISDHELDRREIKSGFGSRRDHSKRLRDRNSNTVSSQEETIDSSTASMDNSLHEGKPDKEEYLRHLLRLTKEAVPHAESWDRLNKARMRSQLENQELVKYSQLVQKILTGEHSKSWDDLNEKLRKIKAAKSRHDVGGGETSDAKSRISDRKSTKSRPE